jgi:uncharacterized protein (DUF1786 family)
MRLLTIDVGTGTQDILLLDTSDVAENAPQMVMPSPTMQVARKIVDATKRGGDILLTGSLMGGGPCAWAADAHMKAGHKVYATESAALTFDDEIDKVKEMGVLVVSEDEARRHNSWLVVEMRDLDVESIQKAMGTMGAPTEFDGLAVAVLDHGNAPPGYSDRLFRFDHFKDVLQRQNSLYAFAYLPEEIPDYLTRMKAVAESAHGPWDRLFLDSGVAAAIGSLDDPVVGEKAELLLANLGNMHTLAFLTQNGSVRAFMEHHTGFLDTEKLDGYLDRFIKGDLSHQEVFDDMGHGVLYVDDAPLLSGPFASVTGPKRRMMRESQLAPYFAAPFGSMMLTGCFGLARAFAYRFPQWREEIEKSLV